MTKCTNPVMFRLEIGEYDQDGSPIGWAPVWLCRDHWFEVAQIVSGQRRLRSGYQLGRPNADESCMFFDRQVWNNGNGHVGSRD